MEKVKKDKGSKEKNEKSKKIEEIIKKAMTVDDLPDYSKHKIYYDGSFVDIRPGGLPTIKGIINYLKDFFSKIDECPTTYTDIEKYLYSSGERFKIFVGSKGTKKFIIDLSGKRITDAFRIIWIEKNRILIGSLGREYFLFSTSTGRKMKIDEEKFFNYFKKEKTNS